MAVIAVILFGIALVGISTLFALKWAEVERGVVVWASMRPMADQYALYAKRWLLICGDWLAHLPNRALFILRILLHISAKQFARLAESASRRAHHIADLVSHRHRFERRETNSDFLKKVSAHKDGLNK